MDEGRTFPLPAPTGWAPASRDTARPDMAVARFSSASVARPRFLTILTRDRIGQARIWARSARQCHPEAQLIAVVLGAPLPTGSFEEFFDLVIPAAELGCDGLADMQFRYSTAELCFALKPWALRHLFARSADGPITYFDSDIELFTPLIEAEAALNHGASLVLTPHILRRGRDQAHEKFLLQAGSFNAGFVAMAPSEAAQAFLGWWCERVRTGCTHDPAEGTYGDQKWLELAPSICDGVAVLRHPGYNFAYWNAHERPLSWRGGIWMAADAPLRFVHYSRWDLQQEDSEQYLARFFISGCEPFADLFAEYHQKVQDEAASFPLPGTSDDGGAAGFPALVRDAYARHAAAIDGDAAAVAAHAVAILDRPSPCRADLPDLPVSILYDDIWQRHADLRYRFDIDRRSGRTAYLRWLVETGAAELAIPPALLQQARVALDRHRVRELETTAEAAAVPAIAAGDPDGERLRRQQHDIRLLVGSNKALRRDLQALRVRRWRDEERISTLEGEIAQLRERGGSNAAEPGATAAGERQRLLLPGSGPFYQRGFRLGEAAFLVGERVRRRPGAASGMLVFGPYLALEAGSYVALIEARLYRLWPPHGEFTVDIVHDGASQVVARHSFRLSALGRRRRCRLMFALPPGSPVRDLEIRIWAARGTPLEVGEIALQPAA
ncbi:MAG: hypothetical protein ACM3JG_12860 [Thiohalocapsa sp.]